MKVLFCHDGPLRKDELNNYYGTAHNDKTFLRYYTIADELNVAIRVSETSSTAAISQLSKITVPNLKVYEVPNISSVKGIFTNKKKANDQIKKAIQDSDYVVVRLPSVIGFKAFDYAKKLQKPCLVEVVACAWDAFWNHSLAGKIIAPTMYYKTKFRVLNAESVVYVTNDFLQKRYPTNGNHVNCSNVALEDVNEEILVNRLRKISNLKHNEKIIIGTTAAVNVRYKGQQYIIEAIGNLKKQGISYFEYHLVGGGDQSYLKSIAKKHNVESQIKFLGSKPHTEIFRWLETIDLYSQPSRQEGLPRALIEAMSIGVPAFGANTAGIPELLDSKFIFNNNKNNIKEISEILLNFNTSTMNTQAKRNFQEAKKYEKNIIETRRREFFEKFSEINEF